MATTDVVEIVIGVVNNTKDELAEIRAELQALGAMDVNVDFDLNGVAQAEAKANAVARDRTIDLDFQTALPKGATEGAPALPSGAGGGDIIPFDSSAARTMRGTGVNIPGPGRMQRTFQMISNIDDPLGNAKRQMTGIRRTLGKITPNIMDLWNAMAALIPVMISLGAAAIGLAGALLTLGAAGAAIVGLGLLGWGDSFSESLSNASSEAEDLGSRIFDVLQPAAGTFQPILQGWMEGAPRQIQRLVEPMQRLAVFSDAIGAAGTGFVGWIGEAIRAMVGMEEQIEQIVLRFGDIAGTFIIDFMENMTQFAYENQEALIQMSGVLRELFGALLDVSIAVTTTLTAFSPLVSLIGVLAEFLNTRIGRGLLTMVGLLLTLRTAIASVNIALWVMQGGVMRIVTGVLMGYIPAVNSAILTTWQWFAALTATRQALVALLATTGVGLLLAGAGIVAGEMMNTSPSASTYSGGGMGGGGGGGGGTYINVEGDVGRREMDRLLDTGQVRAGDEHEILEGMNNG